MLLKGKPLNLAIIAFMCTLPAAGAVVPAAIAQEEKTTSLDEQEDLASGIISDVLDDGDDEDDNENDESKSEAAVGDTNIQVAAPIIDQDQTTANIAENRAANRAANLGLEVLRIQPPSTQPPGTPGTPSTQPPGTPGTPPPPDKGVYCVVYELVIGPVQTVCFRTQEECQGFSQAIVGLPNIGPIVKQCQRYEEPPPGAVCARFEGTVPVQAIACSAL